MRYCFFIFCKILRKDNLHDIANTVDLFVLNAASIVKTLIVLFGHLFTFVYNRYIK